ncbi:hypothetical protein [Desulfosporosinus youngiae]|uniref:Uncharacterized protein n=1 Tax=Desulfosporosinus youngiae DSM 17734 TaxID=768710 RepID=H5XVF4_9FIRM|nr:hypothetical protein [Desulfosporosinus youngiae]EHQ89890.1 hypothetical protein DesyoDRAFT_2842 [Desulfosporosinus youngiae DSM 17734]
MKKLINSEMSTLLVPMKVYALRVGKSPVPTVFTNLADDFTRIKLNPLGDLVPSELMSDKTTEKPGIHVHWFIPKSLRQGIQASPEEPPVYPRVPNRYIITRLWKMKNESTVSVKNWLVESDVLQLTCTPENYNDDSCSYPYLQDSQLPYRFLGRVYPYGTVVSKAETSVDVLTTINSGNPVFSVVYSYCRNVFGFYDDLLDDNQKRIENADISYSIRGYYEGEALIVKDADECLGLYNWKPSAAAAFPAKPFLHGFITNISWESDLVDYNGPFIRGLKSPELAVGNTSAEALSALKSSSLKNENLMKVLLNNKVHELTELNGVFKSNYSEHEQRFITKSEEKIYTLQSLLNSKDYQELPDIPALDKRYYDRLKRLESERTQSIYELNATKSEINDIWSKYVLKSLILFPPADKAAAQKWMKTYEEMLKTLFEKSQQLNDQIQELQKQIEFLTQQLNEDLKNNYEAQKTAGDRYFEPNAPVLLLSGVERNHVFKPKNEDGKDDPLICRSISDTLDYLPIAFKLRGQDYAVQIQRTDLIKPDALVGECKEVLLESALFLGCNSSFILESIINKTGIQNLTAAERAYLLQEILTTQKTPFSETGKIYPDANCMNFWEGMNWEPIMLYWRGLYYPDKELLTSQPSLKNWKLQDSDYTYIGEAVTTDQPVTLEGRILLTPQVTDLLYERVQKYLADHDLNRLKGLNELGVLSQMLDSFNDRFLMNLLVLRFPAIIYKNGSVDLADAVRQALSDFIIEKPIFNSFFSPLRGGFFKFDKIRLIDTFGEFQNVECKSLAISEDLSPEKGKHGTYVMLPPRFMQSTKLQFDFLDSKTNAPCDFSLKDTPICGWVIPNHIDQSLMLYDESGQMLGSLVVTGFKDSPVMLRPAAGHSEIPIMQREIKAFADEILSRSSQHENVLTPLLGIIDSSFWDIQGSGGAQSTGLSLYIGRPLVLARARMSIVQEGPLARFKVLESNTKTPVPIPPTSIESFKMPLVVGERDHLEDGVIGFFIENGQKTYAQFNSIYCQEETSDYFNKNNKADIPMAVSGKNQTLTVLIDPLQTMNLISGMLPVMTQRIPQNRIETALNSLYLTLYTGPILVGNEPLVMPYANIPDRAWSFIVPLGDDKWYETSDLYPANGNAFLAKDPIGIAEGFLKLKAGENHETK